ncbi:MAG: signal peptide peptidase SppA, partial [Bacteroidales bacterium]|nr:signal peptide peptidase SppA [Bacteroidales bacterium]
ISTEELNKIADDYKIRTAEDALKYKFVDKLTYRDEVLAELVSLTKVKEIKDLKSISLNKYNNVPEIKTKKGLIKDKIAVIYAVGNIQGGEGDEATIGSDKISRTIRQARTDKNIKAIVLRVNSPGGSALASEVILRELILAKQDKPVVVSMGDLAASGGYYIACNANKIFAESTTITGSIGVFGLMPNIQGLLNKKLGVTIDGVKTNKFSDFGIITRPLNETEKIIILNDVDRIYNVFINHVSKGRNIPIQKVDSIGQGRVWSATDAKNIGLIDEIGSLDMAIAAAADLAKIKNYKIIALPTQKDFFQQIIDEFSGNTRTENYIKNELGIYYDYLKYIKYISENKGVQARLPYQIIIE